MRVQHKGIDRRSVTFHKSSLTLTQQNIDAIPQIFTVKQHDPVPRDQVAVNIFVREVNCCCDIIQELKESENTEVKRYEKGLRSFPLLLFYSTCVLSPFS